MSNAPLSSSSSESALHQGQKTQVPARSPCRKKPANLEAESQTHRFQSIFTSEPQWVAISAWNSYHDCSRHPLEGAGRCWKVLEGAGRCWKVLVHIHTPVSCQPRGAFLLFEGAASCPQSSSGERTCRRSCCVEIQELIVLHRSCQRCSEAILENPKTWLGAHWAPLGAEL